LKRAGAETRYVADRNQARLARKIAALAPDLVCYSTMSGEMPAWPLSTRESAVRVTPS